MKSVPTRTLRKHPDLDQLKRQAKELLDAFRAHDTRAIAEASAHFRDADPVTFALHDAQLALARSYGFQSWPKLKAYVDGASAENFKNAIRAGDLGTVSSILKLRPELANIKLSGYDDRALHHAVAEGHEDMVRLLLEFGADPYLGMHIEGPSGNYPSAFDFAAERNYSEMVALFKEKSQRARDSLGTSAARCAGASAEAETNDATARSAVIAGNAEWLRTQHAEGTLGNPRYDGQGLVSTAVRYNQPEILALLLDLGFDPDERIRLDLEPAQDSWGQPLMLCVRSGQREMAKLLLEHGADPNGHIYAAGTPTSNAYSKNDAAMIDLMERHGGYLDADLAGYMGMVDKARQMLEDEAAGRLRPEAIPFMKEGSPIAEILIGDGLGNIEMVKLALPRINRPRDDPWWAGRIHRAWGDFDVPILQMLLERCDVAVCAPTELHQIAGNWPRSHRYDPVDRLAKATVLLDAGARLDMRDEWFKSTPLGWACRYGRIELVKLYLERGADPVEADAEPWATPRAWAEKMNRPDVAALLS